MILEGSNVPFANDLMESLLETKADEREGKKLQPARDFLKYYKGRPYLGLR